MRSSFASQVRQEGHIAYVTIDNPDTRTLEERRPGSLESWPDFRDDPSSTSPSSPGRLQSFCAGSDLRYYVRPFRALPEWNRAALTRPDLVGITKGINVWKPIIAASTATAWRRMELAMACDMRIAADHATFGW